MNKSALSTTDPSIVYYLEQKSQPAYVYLTLLAALSVLLIVLPMIQIDVSISCRGALKPAIEPSAIRAIGTGLISQVHISENQIVRKGDLLVEVHSLILDDRGLSLKENQRERLQLLNDVTTLMSYVTKPEGFAPGHKVAATSVYRQALTDYTQRLNEKLHSYEKAKNGFRRNKLLYDSGVIAAAEMENISYELSKATNDISTFKESQLMDWQQQLLKYQQEVINYQNDLDQLLQEQRALNMVAPIAGAVQHLSGIYSGSYVLANQELGYISPDTTLVAEIYVTPEEIGLLRKGMDTRIMVNTFNYNQWGFLSGTIAQISEDISVTDDRAFFKVICRINCNYLELRNGYRGMLKKGMTVQVRFFVNSRTLWQLLYDSIDDWMNPNLTV